MDTSVQMDVQEHQRTTGTGRYFPDGESLDIRGMEHGGDPEDSEQVVPGLHSSGYVLNGIGGPREWTTSQEDDLPSYRFSKASLRRCRASYVQETMSTSRLKEATLMGRDASRQDDTLRGSASMSSEEYSEIWKDNFAVFSTWRTRWNVLWRTQRLRDLPLMR